MCKHHSFESGYNNTDDFLQYVKLRTNLRQSVYFQLSHVFFAISVRFSVAVFQSYCFQLSHVLLFQSDSQSQYFSHTAFSSPMYCYFSQILSRSISVILLSALPCILAISVGFSAAVFQSYCFQLMLRQCSFRSPLYYGYFSLGLSQTIVNCTAYSFSGCVFAQIQCFLLSFLRCLQAVQPSSQFSGVLAYTSISNFSPKSLGLSVSTRKVFSYNHFASAQFRISFIFYLCCVHHIFSLLLSRECREFNIT